MTDRLAEKGALAYAAENTATASTSPNRLGGAGYLHAAYAEYQTWAAANPNTNPSRLSAKGRLFGYFYDNASWSPSSLFAAGEQGAWYDPSDFSTMFQDAAGTTPVTAVEQPVGKILDKSGRGNHASQSTTTKRPILRARHNLLTYSEQFDNAAWGNVSGTVAVTANTISAPNGTLTADKLVPASATSYFGKRQTPITSIVGAQYSFSVYAKLSDAGVHLELDSFNSAAPSPGAVFNLSTGSVLASRNCTTTVSAADADGWRRYTITFTATASASTIFDVRLTESSSLDATMTGNASKGIYVWGVDLRAGTSAGTYQRIAAATDYDTVGFPHYFDFDGTDDSWATASIDFSATDKMSVFAGVRKNNDTGAIVAELSSTIVYNGSFYLVTGNDAGGVGYSSIGKGTAAADIAIASKAFTFNAPDTAVLTVTHDISGDLSTIRRNGAAGTSATGDKGAGNFGNYPLYIGQRGGSSLPFNGRIYSLIVLGRTATAAEITATEAWVANKTGVQL